MTSIEEQEYRRPRGKHFFIPAGVLIGLGAGLIAGYPWSGILIGLGLGFLAQALFKSVKGPAPDPAVSCCGFHNRWISVVIGLFLIVIGVGIIWSPTHLWPYIFGIFLIIAGILVAAISLRKVC
ncbi:MAG: hypothetical protein NTW33_01965 [Methanoregula sp.]|nr:hypothetical protein [Methanoregula sp.]